MSGSIIAIPALRSATRLKAEALEHPREAMPHDLRCTSAMQVRVVRGAHAYKQATPWRARRPIA